MARGAAITVENNFVRGLVTEFTAMNFPENAVTEGDNCVFSELGFVTRRLGMEYENGRQIHTMTSLSSNPNCFVEFKWASVDTNGATTFLVQQVGDKIHFFAVLSNGALSANKKSFSIDLSTFAVGGASAATISGKPCQFTSGKGFLFVVHPNCSPFYVEYDSGTDSITTTAISIEIRDFERLDDGLDIDTRPTTITNLHKYNLYNQGWGSRVSISGASNAIAFEYWDSNRSDFPSNADIFWLFKNSSNEFRVSNVFDRNVGNTPAPNGHFIYDAFNIDRTAKTGFSGLPTLASDGARPSSIAFYAGRIFYAGTPKAKFSDKVYFTQIVEGPAEFGACYQRNDPTSDNIADLLDNDGGVLSLPLIDSVVGLKVIGDVLVVMATNGIYTITGTQQGPFKATDYTVTYVSSIGASSHLSLIEVDGGLLWFNNDGIYALARDNIGNFGVTNASKNTIQTLINSIPSANISFVKGAYNRKDQLAQWLFSDDDALTGYKYNRILEFNIISRAFYTHTIDTTLAPRISGIITLGGQRKITMLENVTDNALAVVTTNAAANVQVEVDTFVPSTELFKYTTTGLISSGTSGLTYSELWNTDLIDWETFNSIGVAYTSYGISGYRVRGDFLRPFNSTPVTFIVKYLGDAIGRCIVAPIWDYGFRIGSDNELYLTRPEVDYIVRRVKLRGKGKSLQIRFQSVGNNPFNLVGWSTFDTGGTIP